VKELAHEVHELKSNNKVVFAGKIDSARNLTAGEVVTFDKSKGDYSDGRFKVSKSGLYAFSMFCKSEDSKFQLQVRYGARSLMLVDKDSSDNTVVLRLKSGGAVVVEAQTESTVDSCDFNGIVLVAF